VHVSADEELPPVHAYPLSTVHVDEQPSPDVVSPSSHASVPVLNPLPQTDAVEVHVEADDELPPVQE